LIPSPILKVLSTLATHQVQYLLMGGQACVLYGAAEFSRDTDLNVLTAKTNLDRLSAALGELQAKSVAVPPWDWAYLDRGHALHFRCFHPEAAGMRVDVMSVCRGVAPFENLWSRRTTVEIEPGTQVEVMSLSDLVMAKKTQRDKDWPMIRRLVEAHYSRHRTSPTQEQIAFWLMEARTPTVLTEIAAAHPHDAAAAVPIRPLLSRVLAGDAEGINAALIDEESRERKADRIYWTPLREELERLRNQKRPE
jgi:hypothetical protein